MTDNSDAVQDALITLRRKTYGTTYHAERIALGIEDARERDISTVFIDIADSTPRIMSMSSARAKSYIEDFMEVVAQATITNNGYVDKFMGDGAMVLFGLQVAEDTDVAQHPAHAVAAAREIIMKLTDYNSDKPEMEQLHVRVGIDSGIVMAGAFSNPHRMVYTGIGPSVNISARLEKKCAPDSVLITHAHHERVAMLDPNLVADVKCSMLQLKGISGDISACGIFVKDK